MKEEMRMAVFGCIADDFTGAGDAASFLVKGGMSVTFYNGIPEKQQDDPADDAQAIVIALKSRTQETSAAVKDSIKAAQFLLAKGVKQIYYKYCSTFDSTPAGNIGPVADALIDLMNAPYTVLCPALPVNGRTVENGRLMVNGIPLHESHMKDHPLTPMWDCRIDKLMEPQSRYPCFCTNEDLPPGRLKENLGKTPYYLIPDYRCEEDGVRIASRFGHLPLLTGGSGLLEPLARMWTEKLSSRGTIPESGTDGQAILLAGSCSKATLAQIARYQQQGGLSCRLDPFALTEGRQTVEDVWDFIQSHPDTPILVYSSDTPERVKESQKLGVRKVAALLEGATARLASMAVNAGYTRIISAGGETSGAVTKGLGFSSYRIGESVAPGVPVMVPAEKPDIRLVLKSGNFGQEDFFERALQMTGKK